MLYIRKRFESAMIADLKDYARQQILQGWKPKDNLFTIDTVNSIPFMVLTQGRKRMLLYKTPFGGIKQKILTQKELDDYLYKMTY